MGNSNGNFPSSPRLTTLLAFLFTPRCRVCRILDGLFCPSFIPFCKVFDCVCPPHLGELYSNIGEITLSKILQASFGVVGASQSVCIFCTEHVLLFRSVVGWQYQILCWVLILSLGTYIH
jgi:hypothetical protein